MGVSKKQLMDAVGMVKEYVDKGLGDERATANRDVKNAVRGECVFDFSFNYTTGCDMTSFIKMHGMGNLVEGSSQIADGEVIEVPSMEGHLFAIVTLDVSREASRNGTTCYIHNTESKLVPISFLLDHKIAMSAYVVQPNVSVHKIKTDIVSWSGEKGYYVLGTAKITFILYDGEIDIVAYEVEADPSSDDSSMRHTVEIDIRYCIADYWFVTELGSDAVEDTGVGTDTPVVNAKAE